MKQVPVGPTKRKIRIRLASPYPFKKEKLWVSKFQNFGAFRLKIVVKSKLGWIFLWGQDNN